MHPPIRTAKAQMKINFFSTQPSPYTPQKSTEITENGSESSPHPGYSR